MSDSWHRTSGDFFITIRGRFEAAHYLYGYFPDGSDEPLHGHSYVVEVSMARNDGAIDDSGISLDFVHARDRLKALMDLLDHQCLNELEAFQHRNPTAEHIALWVFRHLQEAVESSRGRILEIRVHEGPEHIAIFRPA